MRLIFCGTPDFAVPTLERLIAEDVAIDLVVTNPDEPSGRGYELKAPLVKQVALRSGLGVFQAARLKDPTTVEFLSRFRPDAIVVVAYGHIIPKWMIELPRFGCINLHASLLPKYRGAAPIQWALIRGETLTGVTTMRIDEGLDTGDILLKREVSVRDEDTTETLRERLSLLGADLVVETLLQLEREVLQPQPQDHTQATRAPILKKEDGRIDWVLPAREIWNRIRGLRPWPGAYTTFRGKNLHIWAAGRPSPGEPCHLEPGTLVAEHGRLLVACGQGTLLEAKEIQLEGRKRLPAPEFLNGVRLLPGERVK
ncbi:MAG: methionyl-tRNA formyltransferase [Acidobacteriia bacterium]|nr:methionyl-tRNA formyltransferase [Terriglobia bacterium]